MANFPANVIVLEAPCPGVVWRIGEKDGERLREGDYLRKGEEILNLEFMKIQIPIFAPFDCKIIKLSVTEGMSVNQGDVLVILEKLRDE